MRFSNKIFLLYCLLTLFYHSVSAQSKLVFSSVEEERKLSFGEISYTAEADSITSFEKALKVYRKGKFTINTNRDLNLGIAKDNYWVAFELQNESARQRFIITTLRDAERRMRGF